jgi:hypothetical protein
VPQVIQDIQVLKVQQDHLDQEVRLEGKALKEHKDQQVRQVLKVLQVIQDIQEPKVPQDH